MYVTSGRALNSHLSGAADSESAQQFFYDMTPGKRRHDDDGPREKRQRPTFDQGSVPIFVYFVDPSPNK